MNTTFLFFNDLRSKIYKVGFKDKIIKVTIGLELKRMYLNDYKLLNIIYF